MRFRIQVQKEKIVLTSINRKIVLTSINRRVEILILLSKYCATCSIPILKFLWVGLMFLCRQYCENLYMQLWYLCFSEDLHDALMMLVVLQMTRYFLPETCWVKDEQIFYPPYGMQCLWKLSMKLVGYMACEKMNIYCIVQQH